MSELLQFDQYLFHLINSVWTTEFLDTLMPVWRSKYLWLPFYIFLISFLLINFGKKGGFLFLFALATIAVSDTLSSQIIKKNVQRARPCTDDRIVDLVDLKVKCGGGYSYTSSHATNHFALAFFLIFTLGIRFRWIKWVLIFWAASISYGQVYVGVHYPLDVISGAMLGMVIGILMATLYGSFREKKLGILNIEQGISI